MSQVFKLLKTMKIYDISQELFTSSVYPGDKKPEYRRVKNMHQGDIINLTEFELCAHNGTHIDAPKHFIKTGKAIEEIELSKCIGECSVITLNGELFRKQLLPILSTCKKRLLIKGNITITLNAAKAINEFGILLIGVESQSVGKEDAPMPVHLELLSQEVVLLEGIRLNEVEDGDYLLCAAPINLGGSDGAPCRAVLIQI